MEQLVKSDNFGLTDCLLIEGPQHVPLLRFGEEGGEFWRGGRGGGGWSAVVAKHIFVRLFQLCGIYPLSSCHPALLKKDNYHKSLFPEVEEEMKKIGELVTEKSEHTASLIQDIVCLVCISFFFLPFFFPFFLICFIRLSPLLLACKMSSSSKLFASFILFPSREKPGGSCGRFSVFAVACWLPQKAV